MYQKKLENDIRCPLEYGLDIFGGRWNSRVICVLDQFTSLRYGALKKAMENITDAVLSSTLKTLLKEDMISRRSFDEIPPRVEYSLTDKGRSVIPLLHGICKWSKGYFTADEDAHIPRYCSDCCFYRETNDNNGGINHDS